MNDFPEVGIPVKILNKENHELQSRVENYGDSSIILALPSETIFDNFCHQNERMLVTWCSEKGLHTLPVRLHSSSTEGIIRLWELEILDEVSTTQRRNYVRVKTNANVDLAVFDSDSEKLQEFSGMLVDLSEVSIKVRIEIDSDLNKLLEIGKRINFDFLLGSSSYSENGELISIRDTEESNKKEIVIHFNLSEAKADYLRREIFTIQRDNLRRNR